MPCSAMQKFSTRYGIMFVVRLTTADIRDGVGPNCALRLSAVRYTSKAASKDIAYRCRCIAGARRSLVKV